MGILLQKFPRENDLNFLLKYESRIVKVFSQMQRSLHVKQKQIYLFLGASNLIHLNYPNISTMNERMIIKSSSKISGKRLSFFLSTKKAFTASKTSKNMERAFPRLSHRTSAWTISSE